MNRFDTYQPQQYVDTYSPLPIQEMYTIGKDQINRIEAASKELTDQTKEWSKFQSQSQVDTDTYYNEVMKGAQDLAEQYSKNPDLIKTPEGRNQIESYINSRDYGLISKLQQNAENFKKRSAVVAEMTAKGVYNPQWDDVNMNTWDTRQNGIMSKLAPVEYKEVGDLADPYFEELSKNAAHNFKKSDGQYDYYGVDDKDLSDTTDRYVNQIANTIQGNKHIETLMQNQGLDRESALKAFKQQVLQSQQKRLFIYREPNKYGLLNAETAAQRSLIADRDAQKGGAQPPQSLTGDVVSDVVTAEDNYVRKNAIVPNQVDVAGLPFIDRNGKKQVYTNKKWSYTQAAQKVQESYQKGLINQSEYAQQINRLNGQLKQKARIDDVATGNTPQVAYDNIYAAQPKIRAVAEDGSRPALMENPVGQKLIITTDTGMLNSGVDIATMVANSDAYHIGSKNTKGQYISVDDGMFTLGDLLGTKKTGIEPQGMTAEQRRKIAQTRTQLQKKIPNVYNEALKQVSSSNQAYVSLDGRMLNYSSTDNAQQNGLAATGKVYVNRKQLAKALDDQLKKQGINTNLDGSDLIDILLKGYTKDSQSHKSATKVGKLQYGSGKNTVALDDMIAIDIIAPSNQSAVNTRLLETKYKTAKETQNSISAAEYLKHGQ